MREELYRKLKTRLEALCVNAAGEYYERPDEADVDDELYPRVIRHIDLWNHERPDEADMDDELYPRAIKHIDLWNHNVEFLEQEAPWPRPAVFIEFVPFKWHAIVPGVEYRAEPLINLHVVTDWTNQDAGISQFRLLDKIHGLLACLSGENFMEFDIDSSATNHNHEEIVENIETYRCTAIRRLTQS